MNHVCGVHVSHIFHSINAVCMYLSMSTT